MKAKPAATTPLPGEFLSRQVTESSYYLPQSPVSRRTGLRVMGAGMERVAGDYRVARPGFHCFGLEFVAAGRGRLVLGSTRHLLQPGTVFLYGPGVPHEIVTDAHDKMTKYFVDFSGTGARRLLKDTGLTRRRCIHTRDPVETRELFDALLRNGRSNSPQAGEICALLLRALILQTTEAPVAEKEANSPAHERYLYVRNLIDQHAQQVSSLGELAKSANLDPAYLCRLFRRFEGRSPNQALLDLKLRHAAALLREPGAMVKNVARDCGFSDPYHFSRLFKLRHGLAPRHFAERR